MESLVDGFQPVQIDMSINLSGGDIGVAEHLLHHPEIRSTG
jgi:hypothetical protein